VINKHDIIQRDVRVAWMHMVYYCAAPPQFLSKGRLLLRRRNGVKMVSRSFSRILWLSEEERDVFHFPFKAILFCQRHKLKMFFILDITTDSLETWKIKRRLFQTDGVEAWGAPYLATNYTWSKKRKEGDIKTKLSLKSTHWKPARCITARTEQEWAWIHMKI